MSLVTTTLVPGQTYLESLKSYVGFDDVASTTLRDVRPLVSTHIPPIIDDFYNTIARHPGASAAITGGAAQVERLKQTLRRWLDEVFGGPHDEAYFERRARIGRVHVKIDLPQAYMLTAMDRIRLSLLRVLRQALFGDPARLEHATDAVNKILDIDLAIMLETYREDLLQKNRATERLATIGQFAAGIGHELRNPLGVVESSAFLVRQRLEQIGTRDASLDRHLGKISAEVQRASKTINDLLELARSRPPKRKKVSAASAVAQAVLTANLPAGVAVQVDAPDDVLVDADVDQLARTLSNLFINASQAMNGKGSVRVEARRQDGVTSIRVRDEGPGVPPDVRHRIFEALFTTKAQGSGIGLALSRRIAEAHGGNVVLDPGERGATFVVTIPDAREDEVTP